MTRRLTGLMASLLIVGIIIGLPTVLLAVAGNPLPTRWPAPAEVIDWLTRPDDGTLALAALTWAGWLVWAYLSVTLLLEVVAAIRGIKTPRLPAVHPPQLAAQHLVAAAALLFISSHTLGPVAVAFADAPEPGPAASQPATPAASSQAAATPPAPTRHSLTVVEHVVGPTDTLSGLARTHLGDADRWPAIFEASRGIEQPDGQHLTNPDLIIDGWTLHIPVPVTTTGAGQTIVEHTVNTGDTLSGAARAYLGDADRWPEIYEASRGIEQPDGQQFSDPDLILEGWTLRIPAQTTTETLSQPAAGNASTEPDASEAPAEPTHTSTDAEQETPTPTVGALPPAAPAPAQPDTRETPTSSIHPAPDEEGEIEQALDAPWLLAGLTAGGVVLAASALLLLRARRDQQFRERRPGRAIALPPPALAPVEKSITAIGAPATPNVQRMDQALRELAAASLAAHLPVPRLVAAELRADRTIALHLAAPMPVVGPWQVEDAESRVWRLDPHTDLVGGGSTPGQPAPYPLLVTCGSTEAGDVWLLNLEALATVRVAGDPVYRSDFLRFIVAELAVNPWSRDADVTLVGLDHDLAAMNPDRLQAVTTVDDATGRLVFEASDALTHTKAFDADSATARAGQLGEEVWPARVLIVDADSDASTQFGELVSLISQHPGATGTAVVSGSGMLTGGVELLMTSGGRITVADLGLDLMAVGLTQDEALGCASLLAVAGDPQDAPMPIPDDDAEGWRALTDQAGALREELTVPRCVPDNELIEPASSVIETNAPLPENALPADLEQLAPKVTEQVRRQVEDADPELDADVADWFSAECTRPRLSVLGPVMVRVRGRAIAKREPLYIALIIYIALREHGATADEIATAFGHAKSDSIRPPISVARQWLGKNPRTGRFHLPNANETPAAQQRGIGVYQVEDLLIDANLFRRLRVRGQVRGTDGINDLETALNLVTGRPFDQLRSRGGSWIVDTGIEHHLVCAIADVAHLLTIHYQQTGRLDLARAATETALIAAPADSTARLDLATITKAEGHLDEARRIIREDICNVADEDGLPADIGARTEEILAGLTWRRAEHVAS